MAITGDFTAKGVSAAGEALADGDLAFSITGTYVADVVIERATTPARLQWVPVSGKLLTGAALQISVRAGDWFRMRCTAYTSGTASYSFTVPAAGQLKNIDNTDLGDKTPAAVHATTLSATGDSTLVKVTATGDTAVVKLTATGAVTANPANLDVTFAPTGTGKVVVNPATAGTLDNVALGVTTPLAVHATTLSATDAVTLSPASHDVTLSPTGTGKVVVNPATAGTLDNVALGVTTPLAAKVTTLVATSTITPSSTAGIVGTTTNDNAQAGSVGEYISSSVLAGAQVSLVSTTAKDITTISVTAGDWMLQATCLLVQTGGGTSYEAGINATTNTMPTAGAENNYAINDYTATVGSTQSLTVGPMRLSQAGTTTQRLIARETFVTSGGAYGFLSARRVR